MPIPFAMTTITIRRLPDLAQDIDGYEANPTPPTTVAKGVRAVIDLPSGSVNLVAGDKQVFNVRLTSDVCDLQTQDQVTDDSTGDVWTVLWARKYGLFGLSHMVAQLRIVEGASA